MIIDWIMFSLDMKAKKLTYVMLKPLKAEITLTHVMLLWSHDVITLHHDKTQIDK